MPSSKQRIEVWRGQRKRTSGGLTKEMLTKNKRGKIVSKKKSNQASDQNNLGVFLRAKGTKVPKDEMLYKKGEKKSPKPSLHAPKKPQPKPVHGGKSSARTPSSQKATKGKPQPKPKAKGKPPTKGKPQKPQAKAKKKQKSNINPVTKQPYAKKSAGGYVADAKIHIDNIIHGKRKRRQRLQADY